MRRAAEVEVGRRSKRCKGGFKFEVDLRGSQQFTFRIAIEKPEKKYGTFVEFSSLLLLVQGANRMPLEKMNDLDFTIFDEVASSSI